MAINIYRKIICLLVFTLSSTYLFQQSVIAASPSFNCKQRLTQNERLICNQQDLSELDVEISNAFHQLTSMLNRAAADLVRGDQKRWLKQRQKCRRNYRCTLNLMRLRLDELIDSLSEQNAFRSPPEDQPLDRRTEDRRTNDGRTDDQINCTQFGQYHYKDRCVDECPPDFVAEPQGKRCRPMSDEERDGGLCGPGFTNMRGKCIHNSELQNKEQLPHNKNKGPVANGIYGIYVLSHQDSLRLDHTADKLLYTQNKSGDKNDPKQPFRFTYHNGSYIITDIKSGLRLHADGNGDWKVSVRYQPKDDFTKFNLTRASEGCFYIQTEASGNYWIWEPNSQEIQVRPGHKDEESMFCLMKQ